MQKDVTIFAKVRFCINSLRAGLRYIRTWISA